ncbi:MAG: helix-turn-helix transcriptional regulator [Thermoleophilia bacterium]|nr:helix-turn-helix transcriptional regulator [Thermoleophilia bacterium]
MRPPRHRPHGPGPHPRPGGRGARCRWETEPGRWEVRARVERFIEPVLLQLLSERPMHGYELLERVPELAREERRVDLGNLYRLLRTLEEEGVVASEWDQGLPGPAKRVYRLTPSGDALRAAWTDALAEARDLISSFIERTEREGG